MDGSSKLQFNPTDPYHLDGNTKSKLGVIDIKGQISVATKSDDVKVPEYVWDMCALRQYRPLRDVDNNYLDMLCGVVDMVEAASC
jgi:hypothetical protein